MAHVQRFDQKRVDGIVSTIELRDHSHVQVLVLRIRGVFGTKRRLSSYSAVIRTLRSCDKQRLLPRHENCCITHVRHVFEQHQRRFELYVDLCVCDEHDRSLSLVVESFPCSALIRARKTRHLQVRPKSWLEESMHLLARVAKARGVELGCVDALNLVWFHENLKRILIVAALIYIRTNSIGKSRRSAFKICASHSLCGKGVQKVTKQARGLVAIVVDLLAPCQMVEDDLSASGALLLQ